MDREIKFRVWNGIEMEYNIMVGKFGVFYVNPSNNGLDENDSASLSPYNTKYFDDIPLMLFTGLKDKNGKEIYEGDICIFHMPNDWGDDGKLSRKVDNRIITFEWNNNGWNLKGFNILNGTYYFGSIEGDMLEIIGNIYQTPELLNV